MSEELTPLLVGCLAILDAHHGAFLPIEVATNSATSGPVSTATSTSSDVDSPIVASPVRAPDYQSPAGAL